MKKDITVEFKNVTKKYNLTQYSKKGIINLLLNKKNTKKKIVLENISFQISKGESVAILGKNGMGKSTIIKLLSGISYPTEGEIITKGKISSILELNAGFETDFTGRENIYFNASIFGLTAAEIDNRVQDIIDFSELGEFIEAPVRTYSSGMYMRLAFSVAINVDADILLIDEILAVGDQHFQDKCYKKLHELKESGKTIVIVSHSLGAVEKLCDRAVWLHEGKIREDGPCKEVIKKYLEVCG